ncbi:sulfatase-like hydrolase/transferase [Deinococcus budaensis]|uniref:Arylsulfatase n=1 Tax=Deinococcus budaensis TaxID=1665626 RepID=A0A7W8GFS5_9DEIO|nr:sulfatase-like hydrolase/transferase [Deinococcus budaensis]MBB5234643.1 arylsulfatase [Deinococcus budaensis]
MTKENGGNEQKKAQLKDGQRGGGQRPNILVLCIDQWDVHMKLPDGVELPALERLQQQGVTFDRHYCTVPICTPSRATMWTGQHAKKVGLWDNTNFAWIPHGLSPDVPTLGTMLREQGYHTVFKGKWHLSESQPGEDMLEPYGFSDYQGWGDMFGSPLQGEMLDGTVAMHAVDWLENKAPDVDQPWLLVASMVNPHDIMYFYSDPEAEFRWGEGEPIMRPKLHGAQQLGFFEDWDPELPANLHDDLSGQPPGVRSYQENIRLTYGAPPESRDDLWKARRNYLINCMRLVDAEFQKVLDALDRRGLWENTIVIYTSDHGEMNGAHQMHQKGAIHYDEAAVVNLTAVVPGGPQGEKTGSVGSHLDLVPTLLDFAGVSEEERHSRYPQLRGRSLRGVIQQPDQTGPRGSAQQPGDGALITWDGLNMLDPQWNATGAMGGLTDLGLDEAGLKEALRKTGEEYGAPDFSRRTFFRAVVDGRYKLVRWFSPEEYVQPGTLNELYARSDVTLHDLRDDPGEMENLGSLDHPGYDPALVGQMLGKLTALIEHELGEDDCPFDLNMFGTREVKDKQAKAGASGDD